MFGWFMSKSSPEKSCKWLSSTLWAVALMGIAAAAGVPDRVRRIGFCAPAAHLAALATGAPCVAEADGYRLVGPGLDLEVVPACAAVDFYCLLVGFLSILLSWHGWPRVVQLAVLPMAWVITVVANAVRLTSCWQVDRWARMALPEALWPGLHMAVGVATFLLALTIVFWGFTRRKTGVASHNSGGHNDGNA